MEIRHPIVEEDLREILASAIPWEKFAGKKILISGAAGFLPAFMVETLLCLNEVTAAGCTVIGLVRNLTRAQLRFSAYAGREDLRLIEADVSSPIGIDERCDFVVHAASQASPKYYGPDPVGTMAANLTGTAQLLAFARSSHCESFLLFSSGEVYGQVEPDRVPTRETEYGYIDILNTRSCYAESKRAAETLTASYVQQFKLPGVIVRPFHTYGPGMALNDGRVFADFIRDIVQRCDLTLHSDGTAVRAFCYLADAIRAFFTVMLCGQPGQAYNVGNPAAAISIGQLAELLVNLFPELGIKINRHGRPATGYRTSPISWNSPNIDLIGELGWRPRHSLESGFTRTVRYFEESKSPPS